MPDTSPHSRRHWRLLAIAAAFAALFASPFLYTAIKKHRASSLAAKSIRLAAANEPEAARDAAEAAFNLAPQSPASLRARARSAATPGDAFFFGAALLQTDAATPEDLRHFLNTCLELNLDAGVEVRLQQLLDAEPSNIDNWLLAGRYHLRSNQLKIALDCASRALEINADNRAARLLTAEIALGSSERTFRDAAAATAKRLVAENQSDAISLQALIALLPDSAPDLTAHPLATPSDQMLASHHRLAAANDPSVRSGIVAETITRHQKTDLAALLHWLTTNQLTADALSLVDYQHARTSADLFTSWCHTMIGAGHTDQLIEILEDPTKHSEIPLGTESLELALVDAYESSGRLAIADVHWNKVLRDARTGNRKGKLLRLAQWAERHRDANRAIGLYRKLLTEAPDYTPHWYDRIGRLARDSDQLPLLLEVTAELYADAPENIVYQHNFAYLSVLAGRDLDTAAAILNSLVERYPQADSARCALALLEKSQGNDAAAATQLEQVSPDRLDPRTKFIYLTLLGQSAPKPESITAYELEALSSHSQG